MCENCPAGCKGCDKLADGTFACKACDTGFVRSGTTGCKALPTCTATQYIFSEDKGANYVCKDCPSTCTACKLENYFVAESLSCSACATGYKKSGFALCNKEYVVGTTTGYCEAGEFAGVFVDIVKCGKCPKECTACAFQDMTQPTTSPILCSVCIAGYTVTDGKCKAGCPIGQYFDGTECKTCAFPCKDCLSANAADCKVCESGYIKKATGCEKKEVIVELDCGKTAIFSLTEKKCKCIKSGEFYIQSKNKCYSAQDWALINPCGMGMYSLATAPNDCLSCKSNDANSVCTACTGGSPQECSGCPSQYVFNRETFSCDSCPSGCEECSSASACVKCLPGYYQFQTQDATTKKYLTTCLDSCPSGTLPSVGDFYDLNKKLFSDDEYQEKRFPTTTVAAETSTTNQAIAIGVSQQPIYSTVPWSFNSDGKPTYLDQLVRLSCRPC